MNDIRLKIKKKTRKEKRIFLILLGLSILGILFGAIVLWLVPYIGFSNIHPKLPLIMALFFSAILFFLIGGAITLAFTIIRGKNLFINKKMRGVVIKFLFPILTIVGKVMGLSKDEIRRCFIVINNELVLSENQKVRPERMLILLPHCLQNHECDVRITGNIENCKRCGRCKIKDIVELSHRYHVSISVATGGTMARRIVKEKRPDLIIGVACERDLTSGIQDAYPIPVFGIYNQRPNGPCFDTDVDLNLIEGGMKAFLEERSDGRAGSGSPDTKQMGEEKEAT